MNGTLERDDLMLLNAAMAGVLEPGSILPEHQHHGPEQTFVVSGSCRIGALSLRAGDYHATGAGSHHGTVVSDEGCELLLVVDKDDCLAA